jgi:exodeoxyribonuclease VIII
MSPGIYYDLPIDEYHADETTVSKSGLSDLLRSPYHYWAKHLDPDRPPRQPPTPAMQLGTLVHCAVLEPAEFDKRYAVAPKVDRRTSAGKADWAAFCATLGAGREAVDAELVTKAQAMANSVKRIGPVADLLDNGHPEVSAIWEDGDSGVLCRCRPDWVSPAGDGVLIADVKTSADASPTAFARAIGNFTYAMQAALYCDGWEAATGRKVHGFVFAAVESSGHPWAAAAYMLDDESLEFGRRQYKRLLKLLAQCRADNEWPGYTKDAEIVLLTLPKWSMQTEIE